MSLYWTALPSPEPWTNGVPPATFPYFVSFCEGGTGGLLPTFAAPDVSCLGAKAASATGARFAVAGWKESAFRASEVFPTLGLALVAPIWVFGVEEVDEVDEVETGFGRTAPASATFMGKTLR